MKKYFFFLSIALVSAAAFTSCGPTTHIEVAQNVNFSNYKTFAWANDSGVNTANRANNDIVDNNIKNAVSAELTSKGWRETTQNPDVLLNYNVTVQKGKKKVSQPNYSYPYSGYFYRPFRRGMGYYYNPGFFSGYTTYTVPIKEGTLTVNMVDTKTNKLVWQGYATGDITTKYVTSQQAVTDVKSIFKKLNLPSEQNG
jgi:hypothetical protein